MVCRFRIGDVDNPLQHAFIWENGGPMVDLNTLIPANSGLELEEAFNINDRGEITIWELPLVFHPLPKASSSITLS